jgi:hypothetical protein
MDPIDFANSALNSLGGIFNFNSSTQQNQAGLREEASNVKDEKDKLLFQSTRATNPRIFFDKSRAKKEIINPRFFPKEDDPSKAHGFKTLPAKPFSSNAQQQSQSPAYANSRIENINREYEKSVKNTKLYSNFRPDDPLPSNIIKLDRKTHIVPSGEVEKERALEERRRLVERMDSYLQKVAEKQGIASPDRVYKGPGKY